MPKPLSLLALLTLLFLAGPAPAQEPPTLPPPPLPAAQASPSVSPGAAPAASATPAKKTRKKSPLSQLSPEHRAQVRLLLPVVSGVLGGFLFGLLFLILALQRRQPWAGAGALLLSIALGGLLGATASLLAGVALWLYLRGRGHPFSHVSRTPNPWVTLAGMIGVMLCYFAAQIIATNIGVINLALDNPSIKQSQLMTQLFGSNRVLLSIFNGTAFCVVLLLVICRPQSAESWRARFGLHLPPLKPTLLWMLAAAVAIVAVNLVAEQFSDQKTRDALKIMTNAGASFPLVVLVICIAAPVFEELIFRGYTFSGWISKIGPLWTIPATSLAFALCHVQYGVSGVATVFGLGVIFAVLRWRTGSLYPCLVLHLATNLTALLIPASSP